LEIVINRKRISKSGGINISWLNYFLTRVKRGPFGNSEYTWYLSEEFRMSKQFKAVFKDNAYNFLIGSDNDDKMTFAYSGTVSTVYRESGRATTIWIVIPVLGGYIVVKIRIESKMLEWDLQMRKVILTPRGDLQLKTIKYVYT